MDKTCQKTGFTVIKFVGGLFVGIFLLIVLLVIVVPGDLDCDDVPFKDINYQPKNCEIIQLNITNGTDYILVNETTCNNTVTEFLLEETALTFRKEMKILDNEQNKIGSYFERVDGGTIKYRYKFINPTTSEEFVVGQIENKPLGSADRYFLSRCDETGSIFRLEEKVVRIDDVEYKLYKDDILIGETSEHVVAICKPDISLLDTNNKPLAILSRDCGDSAFVDKWNIINFQNDIVDNYVVGFIGYITTLKENKSDDNFNIN